MSAKEVDGNRYKGCVVWRFLAGCNHACFDLCSADQRAACKEQHTADRMFEIEKEGVCLSK